MPGIYYGIKATPKGKTRTNMEQSAKHGQIRRYGLYKVDPQLVPDAIYNDQVDANRKKLTAKQKKHIQAVNASKAESARERAKINFSAILPDVVSVAKRKAIIAEEKKLLKDMEEAAAESARERVRIDFTNKVLPKLKKKAKRYRAVQYSKDLTAIKKGAVTRQLKSVLMPIY